MSDSGPVGMSGGQKSSPGASGDATRGDLAPDPFRIAPGLAPVTGRGWAAYWLGVRTVELAKLLWLAYRAWRGDVRASVRLVVLAKQLAGLRSDKKETN